MECVFIFKSIIETRFCVTLIYSLKQPDPDLSHGKPGPQRHKAWNSYQRSPTSRAPKPHRLSVDANLQIPDVLNSASKREILLKV